MDPRGAVSVHHRRIMLHALVSVIAAHLGLQLWRRRSWTRKSLFPLIAIRVAQRVIDRSGMCVSPVVTRASSVRDLLRWTLVSQFRPVWNSATECAIEA